MDRAAAGARQRICLGAVLQRVGLLGLGWCKAASARPSFLPRPCLDHSCASHTSMGDAQAYHELRAQVGAAIDDVGRFLGSLVEGPGAGHSAPAHQLCIDKDIQKFFTSYYNLRTKHADEHLNVAVLALTKSGARLANACCTMLSGIRWASMTTSHAKVASEAGGEGPSGGCWPA